MITVINGRKARWYSDIWEKWTEAWSGEVPSDIVSANYFTPRPHLHEYCKGSDDEGFVYTRGSWTCCNVGRVVINKEHSAS